VLVVVGVLLGVLQPWNSTGTRTNLGDPGGATLSAFVKAQNAMLRSDFQITNIANSDSDAMAVTCPGFQPPVKHGWSAVTASLTFNSTMAPNPLIQKVEQLLGPSGWIDPSNGGGAFQGVTEVHGKSLLANNWVITWTRTFPSSRYPVLLRLIGAIPVSGDPPGTPETWVLYGYASPLAQVARCPISSP
jgi:hypothetical protein